MRRTCFLLLFLNLISISGFSQNFSLQLGYEFLPMNYFNWNESEIIDSSYPEGRSTFEYKGNKSFNFSLLYTFKHRKRGLPSISFTYSPSISKYYQNGFFLGFYPLDKIGDLYITTHAIELAPGYQFDLSNIKNRKSKIIIGINAFIRYNNLGKIDVPSNYPTDSPEFPFSKQNLNTWLFGGELNFAMHWRYKGRAKESKYMYAKLFPKVYSNALFRQPSDFFGERNQEKSNIPISVGVAFGINL